MGSTVYRDVNLDNLGDRTSTGDGTTGPAESGASAIQGSQTPDFTGKGALLEEPNDAAVFSTIDNLVKSQEKLAKNRDEKAKHWQRVRRGVPFSQLQKDEDRALWRAELPPGITDTQQPIPNKADDLCGKIVSQVLADPFLPSPKPQDENDEKDRAAADIAKRFLTTDGDESGTNDAELFHDCLDRAMTRTSFVHVWVDPFGGGWRPQQKMAAPDAPDPSNPLVGANGMPAVDYILRYVTPDGQFTDDPSQADRQWLPSIERDVLTDVNVRTFPETLPPGHADAVVLILCEPLRRARRRFPSLAEMSPDQLAALVDWRPRRPKAIVPKALMTRFKGQESYAEKGEEIPDDALLFWYHKYCQVSQDYPEGAEIAVSGAGGGVVLTKALLRDDVPVEEAGKQPVNVPVLRDIPVSMCKGLHDSEEGDPFGRPPIEKFGGANEALAQIYGAVLEDNDRRLHPNVFLTATSAVQEPDMSARTGRPLYVLAKEDMPTYEQFADLATFTPQIIQKLEESMDRAANLGEVGQVLDNPNAQSGIAKQIVVQEVKKALSQIYGNASAFIKRYWRLKLQLVQAKYTVPQSVEFSGVDSAYKQRWWAGADFHGVENVSVMAGTGTMQSGVQKQQMISFAQQAGWLDPEEAASAGRSSISDDLGLKPNPHEERANRELAQWTEGMPDGWLEQFQQFQMAQQQFQVAQAQQQQEQQQYQAVAMQAQQAGQMAPPPPQQQPLQPPQPPFSPFDQRPCDQDPTVAKARYRVLRDFMATSDYSKQPPEWRSLLDSVSEQARQAAGIQTMSEQAQAALAQQGLPRGVSIAMKGDQSTVAAEEAAAMGQQQPSTAPQAQAA